MKAATRAARPPTGRAEAMHVALHYARLAGFAALCAVHVLVRYVVLGRRTGPR